MSTRERLERSTRIEDVAAAAGVSTATVSRVLRAPERVRPEKRERVLAAVRSLDYTPNEAARVLREGASRMILIDAPRRFSGAFFSAIIHALDEALTARGYTAIIGSTDESREKARRLIDLLFARQIAGVVALTGRAHDIDGRTILDAGVPVVAICAEIAEGSVPSVLIDDELWGRRQAEHLLRLGHRELLYVAGVAGNFNEVHRRRGFELAAAEAGLSSAMLRYLPGEYTIESGVIAGRRFLDMKKRPSGIVCCSDDMAIGFLKAAATGGLICPRDFSIMGFDDIQYAAFTTPSLTTVRQPRRAMGFAGAELLLDVLSGKTRPLDYRLIMDCELIVRDSTGPAPNAQRRAASTKPLTPALSADHSASSASGKRSSTSRSPKR